MRTYYLILLKMKKFGMTILLLGWAFIGAAEEVSTQISIDLIQHYTRTIASMPPHEFWSEVPDGLRDFDGVQFDCRGILELTGMAGFESNNLRPAHISGVPIMQRCDVLHLLLCTTWNEEPGTVIGRMILNYAEGGSESIYFAQETHAQSFWGSGSLSGRGSGSTSPNSKRVWTKNSDRSSSIQLSLNRVAFANPRPDVLIESIDFETCFSQSMPVILGLTLEKGKELLASVLANKQKERLKPVDANYGGKIRIKLLRINHPFPRPKPSLLPVERRFNS